MPLNDDELTWQWLSGHTYCSVSGSKLVWLVVRNPHQQNL